MKILVLDFLCVKAHKNFNENIIESLKKIANIDVFNVNGFYEEKKNDVSYIDVNIRLLNSGSLTSRINSLFFMIYQLLFLLKKKNDYDAVFCLGFETIVTALSVLLVKFLNKKIYLFHHKNIDELGCAYKRKIFGLYQNLYYHIVFEDCFASHLKKTTGLNERLIKVIPHPIKNYNIESKVMYDCVGLCNSNSEDFIEELFSTLDNNIFSNLRFVVRSKKRKRTKQNCIVINSFLSIQEYESFINSSKFIFVALPNSYKYRLSGSIYDAFSMKKKVFTTSKFYQKIYEKKYPGLCKFVSSAIDLVSCVQSEQSSNLNFDCFIKDHSIEFISFELKKLVEENV